MSNRDVTIYKYCAWNQNTIEALASSKIWFSNPATLNDPFDSYITTSGNRGCIDSLVLDILYDLDKHWDLSAMKYLGIDSENPDFGLFLYETLRDFRRRPEEILRKIRESGCHDVVREFAEEVMYASVFCGSDSNDIPLLWSHYGNGFRGVCLEYLFDQTEDCHVVKMDYDLAPHPKLDLDSLRLEKLRDTVYRELNRKGPVWSYEQEIRLMKRLDNLRGGLVDLSELSGKLVSVSYGTNCPGSAFNIVKAIVPHEVKHSHMFIEPEIPFKDEGGIRFYRGPLITFLDFDEPLKKTKKTDGPID